MNARMVVAMFMVACLSACGGMRFTPSGRSGKAVDAKNALSFINQPTGLSVTIH